LDLLLWKCRAEVEYLAFRISILNDLSDYDPASVANDLSADHARELVARAQTALDSDPRAAYKDVREAVDVLTKMSRPSGRALRARRDSSPKRG